MRDSLEMSEPRDTVLFMTRKKPGPKPSGKARQALSVRLSPDELALLREVSKREGVPLTTFIRIAAVRSAKRRKA